MKNKEGLKKWSEALLSNIIGMEAVIKVTEQKIKEHKVMYEIVTGVTVDSKLLSTLLKK